MLLVIQKSMFYSYIIIIKFVGLMSILIQLTNYHLMARDHMFDFGHKVFYPPVATMNKKHTYTHTHTHIHRG